MNPSPQNPAPRLRPTLFFLHALGGSRRAWAEVVEQLSGDYDCVTLDLPGFGDADASTGPATVAESVDWLADQVRARKPALWLPVGHSMGGKFATLLAARAETAEPGLGGLAGVVLLAGSPPSPEPMSEQRRDEMIEWFKDGPPAREKAEKFVKNNTAGDLPPEKFERAVTDVQKSHPHAWIAWLERGSREDWSDTVGTLRAPALIVAGKDDGDLGEKNQRLLNEPHYARATVEVVADAAHLLPLEQPEAVARLIRAHVEKVTHRPGLSDKFVAALASDRTSARTRNILLARLDPLDGPPQALSETQLKTLSALIARVLPGCGDPEQMALGMDLALAGHEGDGWRFAELPDDTTAWRRGLDTLDALSGGFAALPPPAQDGWLDRMTKGEAGDNASADHLSAAHMKLWFEEVRGETARAWLGQPQGMSRIGFDGFANGGDGARKQGYHRTGANDPEAWEPRPHGGAGLNAPVKPTSKQTSTETAP